MAVSLSALLNIKANVSGQGAVAGLGNAIGGIQAKAAAATGGLKALTGAAGMGGLAGAMSTLTPLLSAAGLIGMAKGALDGGAAMYNLSQKTGVSVESLAKFKKAASTSGTDVETVAKAIGKLSKGLVEAATKGTGPTAEGLKRLGISATDASGKLRSADAVMLDIANKFKAMPDGTEKTAAAIALFGRSGAELVPMLNMGGDAIDKLKVKMTGAFAQKADEYKDKLTALGGKVNALGMDIMVALLPALTKLTDGLTAAVDAFNKMPEPMRNLVVIAAMIAIAWGPLTGLFTGLVAIITGIGPALAGAAATVAGFAGALGGLGTAITGALTVIAGFITWPVVLVAALVAAGIAIYTFRDQIGAFFNSVGKLIQMLIKAVWDAGEPIRKFWVDLWDGVMKATAPFFDWLRETFSGVFAWLIDTAYKVFAEPYVKMWEGLQTAGGVLLKALQDGWNTFSGWIGGIFRAIGDTFSRFVVDPLTKAWKAIVDTGKAALRGLIGFAVGIVNSVIKVINSLIDGINRVRSVAGLSTLNKLGLLSVPAFAEGGFVTGPTLAMVGDNAGGREYIVPEGKAAGFAANFMAGARGQAAIPSTSGGATATSPGGPVTVNLTTGPVIQAPDGQRSVSIEEVERLVRDGVSQTIRQLRTPAGRYAMGVR